MFLNTLQENEKAGEDDMYDYDYSIDLAPAAAVPGTAAAGGAFGQYGQMSYMGAPQTAMKAPASSMGGRMMTGQAGRMTTGMPGSQMGRMRTGQQPPGTAAGGAGDVRPMTSVSGAGYQSVSKNQNFDPLNQGHGPAPALAEKSDNSPEDLAREMEKQVNKLIEQSAESNVNGNHTTALELAKEAGRKERQLSKHRESSGLVDQINLDLTYAVCFNLANAYQKNKMYAEALNTYSLIVKNKQYPQAGRLRVNMGNMYCEQKKYPQAIKNYRMALDQIPNTNKEVRFKIFRNIGHAFVRLGQFQDAIQAYETIMSGDPDFQTGFDLILCYYAKGETDKMKRGFTKLLSITIQGVNEEDEEEPAEVKATENAEAVGNAPPDSLRLELTQRRREANQYILTAARLIAPAIDEKDWAAGYKWAIDELKIEHEQMASEVEVEMAIQYLKKKEFEKAIEALKAFEKKDVQHRAMAATNLSFIYFLEQEYETAEKHADVAYQNERYNAKALVNKGNCVHIRGDFDLAKQFYLEAIGVEADCVDAIFNLGLVNIQMGAIQEAHQAFQKLHALIPHNPEVIYQIANLYEQGEDLENAIKWFNILITRVPTDPGILHRMGAIFQKQDDESQAFHYHLESYRHYPVSLDVISWLGVWYVKQEMYEKAIHFFERASQIVPNEVKWRLMVTSCYRRMQNYQKALDLYEKIHLENPENLECLRYLVAICKDLDRPYDEYQAKLNRLDTRQNAGGGTMTRARGPEEGANTRMQHQYPQEGKDNQEHTQQRSMASASPPPQSSNPPRYGQNNANGNQQQQQQQQQQRGSSPKKHNGKVDDDDDFGDTDVGDLLP